MKKRGGYIAAFLILLIIALYIGAFVRDAFVRPYVGDVLVAALLCCLLRCVFPNGRRWMPLGMFVFCAAVETVQLLDLPEKLEFEGTALAIALGSTFDWADILCYAMGCMAFALAEYLAAKSFP